MSQSDVDREIARAFQMWANVTDLAFVHVKNPSADVDIDIQYKLFIYKIISHWLHMAFFSTKKTLK